MDNIVIDGNYKFNDGLKLGIHANEYFNNNFLNTENNKLLPDSILDYFHLTNQINGIEKRITILEKCKENTIENTIMAAEKLHKDMVELKDTIVFNDDFCEMSFNYLLDALNEFEKKWK